VSNEFSYEGEFVEGYKHGLGRYFESDGSYYYCAWEYDKKIGDIIFYDASQHKWIKFKFLTQKTSITQQYYSTPYDLVHKKDLIKIISES